MAPIYEKLRTLGSGEVSLSHSEMSSNLAEIKICNPKAKNAFSGKMMADLADVVVKLKESEEFKSKIVVTLRGADGAVNGFCSGAELGMMKHDFTREDGVQMCYFMQHTLNELRNLPQISIAVVDRFAVGGGTEVALACDLRAFEASSKLQMLQATRGVSPGFGGGKFLAELVGRNKSVRLLCGAQKLTADECLDWGIADCVFNRESNPDEQDLVAFLERFSSQKFPPAVQGCKKALISNDFGKEAEVFDELWRGPTNVNLQR